MKKQIRSKSLLAAVAVLAASTTVIPAQTQGEKSLPRVEQPKAGRELQFDPSRQIKIPLLSDDYPGYTEVLGELTLNGIDPDVVEQTDERYLRLVLADAQKTPFLPPRYWVYQTITSDPVLPVHVNFVVDGQRNAFCVNPDIPYCAKFGALNGLLREANRKIGDEKQAWEIARFVVEMAWSTVHRPDNFLYFRLTNKMVPIKFFDFLKDINDIYVENDAPFRSESRRKEVARVTEKYGEVIKPAAITIDGDAFRLRAWTYRTVRAGGPLREWDVRILRNGTVNVSTTLLEENVGELTWSFAP